MVPATTRFFEAVINHGLTHSGDPAMNRHIDNTVLKTDARGSRLAKESAGSSRKIDLAVAAVMAFARAAFLSTEPAKPTASFIDFDEL